MAIKCVQSGYNIELSPLILGMAHTDPIVRQVHT